MGAFNACSSVLQALNALLLERCTLTRRTKKKGTYGAHSCSRLPRCQYWFSFNRFFVKFRQQQKNLFQHLSILLQCSIYTVPLLQYTVFMRTSELVDALFASQKQKKKNTNT